jgi:hypothetical protein
MHSYTVQQIPPEPHPQRLPGYRAPDRFVVRGTLPPGPFAFQHPPWGTAQEPKDQGTYQFDQVTAVDGEFTLDNLYWYSCHSSYTRCVFHQTGRATSKTRTSGREEPAAGLLGHCPSAYQDCTFDHVDFGLRDGGFLLGEARFERCTFRYCSYRWFRSTHADFIDCTFIGMMQSAWFWGTTPPGGRAAPAQPVHRQRPLPRQAAACAVPQRARPQHQPPARGPRIPPPGPLPPAAAARPDRGGCLARGGAPRRRDHP